MLPRMQDLFNDLEDVEDAEERESTVYGPGPKWPLDM